jgi:hypothetical protein
MAGSSEQQSGTKKFGEAQFHHTQSETSGVVRNAIMQTTLDGFLKLRRLPIHRKSGAESSSARDVIQDAQFSCVDDAPLVKRKRFMEVEAEECSDGHCDDGVVDDEGNDNFAAKKTPQSQPKSFIRDYFAPISSAVYRHNVDAAMMPDIMNLWSVQAIAASKVLDDTPNEAQSATDDSSSSCSSHVERRNGYVLDDFVVASSECDSDHDDDDDVDGDNI